MPENFSLETNNMLDELYQEVLLDHSKRPRCFGCIEHPTCTSHGHNSMCGDTITLYLKLEDDIISDISFDAKGCAISVASASLMSSHIKGKSISEAEKIFNKFHSMIVDKDSSQIDDLGEIGFLAGVQRFPSRIKCATLGWHALKDGIKEISSDNSN